MIRYQLTTDEKLPKQLPVHKNKQTEDHKMKQMNISPMFSTYVKLI